MRVDHRAGRRDAGDHHREAGMQHPPAEPLGQHRAAEHRADRHPEADRAQAEAGVQRAEPEPELHERDREHQADEGAEEQDDDAQAAVERALGEQAHGDQRVAPCALPPQLVPGEEPQGAEARRHHRERPRRPVGLAPLDQG
ncbi:MAG: hypothetical protein U0R70_00810 [Solirubrobacteraceae bacterium]